MAYTVLHARDLDWQPRREGDPRLYASLNGAPPIAHDETVFLPLVD